MAKKENKTSIDLVTQFNILLASVIPKLKLEKINYLDMEVMLIRSLSL